CMQALQNPFSF
nr:immunoglobulin light chain junction region [Macaca mulatta]